MAAIVSRFRRRRANHRVAEYMERDLNLPDVREHKVSTHSIPRHERLREHVIVGYHCTSLESAKMIIDSQHFKCGASGMAGAGIYFATCPEDTKHKARRKGCVLRATVALGHELIVPNGGDRNMTLGKLNKMQKDSVCMPRAWGYEFVVFSADQISNIQMYDESVEYKLHQIPDDVAKLAKLDDGELDARVEQSSRRIEEMQKLVNLRKKQRRLEKSLAEYGISPRSVQACLNEYDTELAAAQQAMRMIERAKDNASRPTSHTSNEPKLNVYRVICARHYKTYFTQPLAERPVYCPEHPDERVAAQFVSVYSRTASRGGDISDCFASSEKSTTAVGQSGSTTPQSEALFLMRKIERIERVRRLVTPHKNEWKNYRNATCGVNIDERGAHTGCQWLEMDGKECSECVGSSGVGNGNECTQNTTG